ncbi:MAG: hypothetical protein M1431_04710 [Candidatus Thermoplasmatota archaeon]|nr:hypothetical protein [Candidatus Thermoplasmatota archaeon]
MGEVKYPLDYGIGIFHHGTFPGYPEKLPDRNTIGYFRERLSKTGRDRLVFNKIRDQIMAKKSSSRRAPYRMILS